MHELSVAENLIKSLKKVAKENNAKRIIKVNLKVNPYSCIDQDNLNFIFSSIANNETIFKETKITIKRENEFLSREIIIENVEIEI